MPSLSEETNGRIERLMPGATIGIIGGGQLGRMMALSARYMGFRIGVLDPTPDCPTAQVADFQVTAEYDDIAAIRDMSALAAQGLTTTGYMEPEGIKYHDGVLYCGFASRSTDDVRRAVALQYDLMAEE